MIELRSYQTRAVHEIQSALERGAKGVLVVAPTGAGKGTVEAAMLGNAARAGRRALFLVHRREIVEDVAGRAQRIFARVGLVLPGYRKDTAAPIQVASVQSLRSLRRKDFDLVIVDEAHHFVAEAWSDLLDTVKGAQLVGFTATPERADGKPLVQHFDQLVTMTTYAELLEQGHLVPCAILRPAEPTGGDLAQDPVDAYLRYARGSSCFMFCARVAAAQDYRRRLRAAGIAADVVSDETSHGRRSAAVDGIKSGRLQVIVNAYTMTEGVDVPRVSTVILARNCQHRGAYVQMTGRALRPFPGKHSALLLDLHGVSHLHGSPTEDRDVSLEGVEPRIGAQRDDVCGREWSEPSVLGVDLIAAGDVPVQPTFLAPEQDADLPRSKVQYWHDLMRDVDAGVLSMAHATAAYKARHGRARA